MHIKAYSVHFPFPAQLKNALGLRWHSEAEHIMDWKNLHNKA